jgi:alkanesulfonate monooxygenase SsuD/methylene tetrahydromethanopterin reductase-like flavin-dependent oxidoreductase (luciferase family)
MTDLVLGLDTFGDVPKDDSGVPVSHAASIRQVVEEAVLADELGVDVIALGEHHRPEYSISTPETVLAAIAARTSRIKLASGVTVLSSDDPVRVFQRFATVDAISQGRAEVILGRGSFTPRPRPPRRRTSSSLPSRWASTAPSLRRRCAASSSSTP